MPIQSVHFFEEPNPPKPIIAATSGSISSGSCWAACSFFLLFLLFFALSLPLLLLLLLFQYSFIQVLFTEGARVLPLLK
uniref:Zinc finger protein, putative n=1 Tax=Arundo donax TaxID=35708 RepID=A0A0A9BL96_ARUDO